MNTIVFRNVGGKGIGFGHYFRSYSLAKAIVSKYSQFNITFVVNRSLSDHMARTPFPFLVSDSFEEDVRLLEQLNPDLFVFDSYLANDDYLKSIKKHCAVLLFDDNNDIYDSTIPNIVLNGNIHAGELDYRRNQNTLYLLGPKYLVMREEYWNADKAEHSDKFGVLITTGGTDPYGVSFQIVNRLIQYPFIKKVIIGPGYDAELIRNLEAIKNETIELIYMPDSLKRYMQESKVVITAAGSTVYEVLTQRTVPILFSMANNQDKVCKSFAEIGVLQFGKYPNLDYGILVRNIERIMSGKDEQFNTSLYNLIDGKGVYRIIEALQPFLRSHHV